MLTMDSLGIYLLVLTVLLGLAFGSFLNVCIYRLPRHESLAFPGSHCPNCNSKIKWFDNIPLVSFMLLGGKCRSCKEKISFIYPLVELLNGVFWVLCLLRFGLSLETLFGFAFSFVLLYISAVDVKSFEISDPGWLVILILGILRHIYLMSFGSMTVKAALIDLVAGAFSGALFLLALYYVFLRITKKEVIGGGDVKLTFAAGAFLGWKVVLFGIGLSAYAGLFVILILVILRKFKLENPLPFGPFLSLGFFVGYLYFDGLLDWYLRTFV